jgi:basic membrane protein A
VTRALLILPLILAVACNGSERTSDTASGHTFKVALLTPGPISDRSWNGGAYDGLLRIRDSLGATISNIQTKTPADFDENFREYGARGFDLVIGHGFEFQDAARRVAPLYPKTVFVTTSGNTSGSNLAGIAFNFRDASYVAGVLAGGMSRSGVLGVVGGTELPPVKESFTAFAAGVKRIRPDARVLTAYIGNWDDVSAGKEQALAQIARGADVIFQNADAAGLGVFQAAREHPDILVLGSNSDQNELAPSVALGSVVIDLPKAFLLLAREVRGGQFKARVVTFDAHSGVVRLVINPAIRTRVPASLMRLVDSLQTAIDSGTFSFPSR